MVHGKDATSAETAYRTVARAGDYALLAIAPRTGRTHQIRVHAAHAGAALVGDRVYGTVVRLRLPSGRVQEVGQVALFAARVRIGIPVAGSNRAADLEVSVSGGSGAPPGAGERKLRDLWTTLGGEAGAWDIAVSCVLGSPSS